MAWNYEREESDNFRVLPVGDYRVKIKKAEKAVSKKGADMLKIELAVSGTNRVLFHYIVFLEDRPEITNRNLTQFFDSFKGIPEGEFDTKKWTGKIGAVHIKHEEYNGNTVERIQYFIAEKQQGKIPAWKEPEKKTETAINTQTETTDSSFAVVEEDVDDNALPF